MHHNIVAPKNTNQNELDFLRCPSCDYRMFADRSKTNDQRDVDPQIRQILPLPNGNWEEISDYLICFEGDTSVDFTTTPSSIKKGYALEDSHSFVLHRDDVLRILDDRAAKPFEIVGILRQEGFGHKPIRRIFEGFVFAIGGDALSRGYGNAFTF